LQRAAYLLYAHAGPLRRSGVPVIGPTNAFIRYIGDVLPARGVVSVDQMPLSELLARPRIQVRGNDGDAAAEVKHSARMASFIRRACYRRHATPQEPLAVRVGVTTVALQPPEMAKIRERVVLRNLP